MATTDSNGLVLVDGSDSMQPLHPVLNSITTSVSNAFNENTRIYPVTSIAARTALWNRLGASSTKPLFIWYSAGTTGRNLMYTKGGNATADWKYYSSSEDTAEQRIWRVANVTGRTTIFNAVGPGSTSNPVMVWRADAPVGQNLEFNSTNSNVTANWHYFETDVGRAHSSGTVSAQSPFSGTIYWWLRGSLVTVRMDVSNGNAGDTIIATLPVVVRSNNSMITPFSEYKYLSTTAEVYQSVYMNGASGDIRAPRQLNVTRRIGYLQYDRSI